MSLFESNPFARGPAAQPVELQYPAVFHFRIIAERETFDAAALGACLAAYEIAAPLAPSRASAQGRYEAYSLSVTMRNRDELHAFDAAVKRVAGVRMVL